MKIKLRRCQAVSPVSASQVLIKQLVSYSSSYVYKTDNIVAKIYLSICIVRLLGKACVVE